MRDQSLLISYYIKEVWCPNGANIRLTMKTTNLISMNVFYSISPVSTSKFSSASTLISVQVYLLGGLAFLARLIGESLLKSVLLFETKRVVLRSPPAAFTTACRGHDVLSHRRWLKAKVACQKTSTSAYNSQQHSSLYSSERAQFRRVGKGTSRKTQDCLVLSSFTTDFSFEPGIPKNHQRCAFALEFANSSSPQEFTCFKNPREVSLGS